MTTARETAAPVRPFLDWRVVTDPTQWAADVALVGIQHSEPYAGDPRPNDQARAPDAVRLHSQQICYGPEQWDFDYGGPFATSPALRCVDCGNFAWVGGSYDGFAAFVTGSLRQLWRQGAQVFVIGGDHGVSIPVLDALDVIGEPVYIVHVDAHLDWRAEVGGVTRGYSSPLRWASTRPWIAGMTQIGMRSTGSARRGEVEDARRYGSRVFTATEVHARGMAAVLESIPAKVPVYVTIDADGMDPTEMPGVMAPAPGGLRFEQVAPLLRTIAARQRVVGLDVVEIAPHFDHANGITSITAGRFILNVLGASWKPEGAFRSHRMTAA
jgi:agmatinase